MKSNEIISKDNNPLNGVIPNTNSLVPTEHEFQVYQVLARNAAQSQFYKGVGGEAQIIMIMLAARELGIKPMMALNGGIHCIQGKIELSARLMASLIRQRGHNMNIKELTEEKCVIEGKRIDNGDTFSAEFTIQEAQKAGLVRSGSNWTKYPKDMLYARAMSRLARQLFPDIIGTSYVEGEIKDAQYEVIPSPVEEVKEDPIEDETKVKELLDLYPNEEEILIREYIGLFANHYKKSIGVCVKDFLESQDEFYKGYSKWKAKKISNSSSVVNNG